MLLRIIFLILNLANVAFIVHIYNFARLGMYFTNWTLVVTVLYLVLAIASTNTRSLSLLALHHIWFEISFMMNIIVVIVFWSTLYK